MYFSYPVGSELEYARQYLSTCLARLHSIAVALVEKKLLLLVVVYFNAGASLAAEKSVASTSSASVVEQLVSIEMESSRPQLVAGEGLGVVARIRNVSKIPVFLQESSVSLTVPLEMEGSRGSVSGYPAYFPTEPHTQERNVPADKYYVSKIRLNPGDTYSAFWTDTFEDSNIGTLAYIAQQITSQYQFLFFTPGKYNITLTTKYWTDESYNDLKYRTVSQSISVPVVAPLFVILLGAALGGIIAYFVLPRAIPGTAAAISAPKWIQWLYRFGGGVTRMFGSALLSVIVTIVLSRVSDAQFLITVTVNDVWGAIVTGFVASYVGFKALEKLLPSQAEYDARSKR